MTSPAPSFGGWQNERSGFIGGLSAGGFALVASAVLVVMVPLYRGHIVEELVAVPIAGLLVAVALVRISGMTTAEWAHLALRHALGTARGQHIFASGVFAPRSAVDPAGAQPMDLPGTLARLRFLPTPSGYGEDYAVVYDPIEHTYALVCRVRYPGLALVDAETQAARVTSWGGLLQSLCIDNGKWIRVAVQQRCDRDDGTALRAWTAQRLDPAAPAAATADLQSLLATTGPSAHHRDTYLTLVLSAARAREAIKAAGGGQAGACAVVVQQFHALRPQLTSAGLTVTVVLGHRELAEVVRTAFDPDIVPVLAARAAATRQSSNLGPAGGVDPELAGPAAALRNWSTYAHDGAISVSYQVRRWPDASVYATVLQPLLKPRPNARRTFTFLAEPLGPSRAKRALSRERTKRASAQWLRRRTGRISDPEEQLEAHRADAQDLARAQGRGVVRFTGLLTVTVTDPAQLAAALSDLEADAAAAAIALRRLYGAQDSGFAAAAVPLGQGLPSKRTEL